MVGILTFHWADDYGAMLQAYGLKRFLNGSWSCWGSGRSSSPTRR